METIIYGAGKIGGLVYEALLTSNHSLRAVWDEKPDACLQFPNRSLITKPSPDLVDCEDRSRILVYVCIFSPSMAKHVGERLRLEGFTNVIDDRSDISRFIESNCSIRLAEFKLKPKLQQCFQCPARRDELSPCAVFDNLFTRSQSFSDEAKDVLTLDTLGLLITTKCNLTCVGCNHLRDLFEKNDNVDFKPELILEDLQKIVSSVDAIKSLVVVGGEALVHPDFKLIISEIKKVPKIGFIQLITNGSYIPQESSVLEVLRDDRLIVEVSGYGSAVGNANIRRREKFLKILSEREINFRYDETANWTDFGDFRQRNYTSTRLKKVYGECCFVSYDLFNGELHKCSRSAYGKFLGKIPDYPRDYIDIRSTTDPKLLRSKLALFKKMIPTACQHCDGTSTKTIQAGVQVVRVNRTKATDVSKVTY
jgi:organic radical activating enzyme